jgi:hypothetical protein
MNIALWTTPYSDFQVCTIVDGFQDLGHTVYDLAGAGRNYMLPWPLNNSFNIDLFIMADTDNTPGLVVPTSKLGFARGKKIPKVIIHGHDLWTDYLSVPNSPKKPVPYAEAQCDIMFVRDLCGGDRLTTPYPVYPFEFAIERRYVEASQNSKPMDAREFDIAFFGTPSTANRIALLNVLQTKFNCYFGDHVTFKEPDNYWSKWVNGRYVHAPKYYEALCNAKFALSPLGAGPSCGRTYEAYAAGCIPLVQKYPSDMEQIEKFIDGENCIIWETVEELIQKLESCLSDPVHLAEFQENCYRFGTEKLLSRHRAQFILDKCKEHSLL